MVSWGGLEDVQPLQSSYRLALEAKSGSPPLPCSRLGSCPILTPGLNPVSLPEMREGRRRGEKEEEEGTSEDRRSLCRESKPRGLSEGLPSFRQSPGVLRKRPQQAWAWAWRGTFAGGPLWPLCVTPSWGPPSGAAVPTPCPAPPGTAGTGWLLPDNGKDTKVGARRPGLRAQAAQPRGPSGPTPSPWSQLLCFFLAQRHFGHFGSRGPSCANVLLFPPPVCCGLPRKRLAHHQLGSLCSCT